MRENQDGTIVLTDGEWNRSRYLHNGNYLLWGMELKLLKQLANGAKFEKVAEYNEEELRIIYKYEKALKDQDFKMRMRLKGLEAEEFDSEGGEQYDYYTIERDYDEGYMNAREPTLKTNRLFDPLYYTQHQMMNDMSDRISTAFHPNAEVREQSGYGTREKQRDAIFNGLKSWNEQMIEDLNGVKRSIDMELGDRKFEAEGGMEFAEWLMNNKPELYFSLLDEKNSPGMVRVGNIDRARSMDFAEWMMYNKPELYFSLIDEREEGFSAETFESETFASDWWSMWRGNFQNSYDQAESIDAIGECVRADGRGDMRLHEAMKAIQTIVNRTYGIGEPVGGEDVRFEDFGAEESINPKDYIAISFLDQQGNGHPTTLLNTYDLRFGERGSTYFKALREALDKGVKRGDYDGYKIKKTTSKPLMDADFDYETPYNNEYGYQVWLMGDKFFYGDSDIPVVKKNKYTINEGEPKFADMVSLITTPKKKRTEPMNGLGSLFGAEKDDSITQKMIYNMEQTLDSIWRCGDRDEVSIKHIYYSLGALADGRDWNTQKDYTSMNEQNKVKRKWKKIQAKRDELGIERFKKLIDSTKYEVGKWDLYSAEDEEAPKSKPTKSSNDFIEVGKIATITKRNDSYTGKILHIWETKQFTYMNVAFPLRSRDIEMNEEEIKSNNPYLYNFPIWLVNSNDRPKQTHWGMTLRQRHGEDGWERVSSVKHSYERTDFSIRKGQFRRSLGGGYFTCNLKTKPFNSEGFEAETFEAKGIDTFTEPFDELKSGSILNKAILLGSLGAGAMIGLKLRK